MQTTSFFALGTRIRLAIRHPQAKFLLKQARQFIQTQEKIFSFYDDASELSQLNRSAGLGDFSASPDLFKLTALGVTHSLAPKSQLNIALGPLIRAWQISFPTAHAPSPDQIKQLLPLCQPDRIRLNHQKQTITLPTRGMAIDLGSIAKGYIADLTLAFLEKAGAENLMLDFGGAILVAGQARPDKTSWQIGIRNPFHTQAKDLGVITCQGKQALATSGTYERFSTLAGNTYHHLLDRQTGAPLNTDLIHLTLLAPTALEADIWSTRLFGLPIQDILGELNRQPHLDGLLVTNQRQLFLSEGLTATFRPFYH